ncbi:MAG TPA: glycosyltransferase family 1 protein [Thermoanaerobaculia bacterium]|nr:glycosyltransferase family 1 protein [Thermoanaerobaculia bacterium]
MSRRICIDGRKLNDFGIGTYIRNLLRALAEIDSDNHYWVLVGRQSRGFVDRLGGNFHALHESSSVYSVRELFTVSWALRRLRPDVYHATHYVLPAYLPCPAVVTIHDIIHLLYPQFLSSRLAPLYARVMIGRSLRLGRRIITVSANTRDDLQDFFGVEPGTLRVVYNGVDETFRRALTPAEIEAKLQGFRIGRPYLLFVGNPKPHKNLENLLRGYARALEITPSDTTLACVGDREGESARLRYLCRSLGVAERVAFLGHVPEDVLPALYQGALAFLYPSLYEGFGLPVVEAMASGVPVITSANSALREVAGGSADLVNPHDVEDIAKAIARCIASPAHRAALVERGTTRSADFDWRTTAERTLEVYREAMSEKK